MPRIIRPITRFTKQDAMGGIDENIIIDNVKYNYKAGGLHSADRAIHINNSEYYLIDVDGTSYYPTLALNNRFFPKQLNADIMYKIGTTLVTDRIDAKRKGLLLADVLKIAVNVGLFGKFGDIHSPLCDYKAKYQITLNGQLWLLKLIELNHLSGIKVFSANTDGVTFKVKPEQLDVFYDNCSKWEALSNVNLEETQYENYIRRDVGII